MKTYNPFNWYWIVGGDETRAYSSATNNYVTVWDKEMTTRIKSEDELWEVLQQAGVLPTPKQVRLGVFQKDATRTAVIAQLQSATPAQVKAYVTNQGITDPKAVNLLTGILLLITPLLES